MPAPWLPRPMKPGADGPLGTRIGGDHRDSSRSRAARSTVRRSGPVQSIGVELGPQRRRDRAAAPTRRRPRISPGLAGADDDGAHRRMPQREVERGRRERDAVVAARLARARAVRSRIAVDAGS